MSTPTALYRLFGLPRAWWREFIDEELRVAGTRRPLFGDARQPAPEDDSGAGEDASGEARPKGNPA